jgi:hypothetical protein
VSPATRADSTAIGVGAGLAIAISLISGLWVVGVVIGFAVGFGISDKMRIRAGLPARGLLTPRDRNGRKR